jgi:hypothetical protein
MPKLLTAFLTFASLAATAQQPATQPTPPPAGSNWQHVQALPFGTKIYVTTRTRVSALECTLTVVDADSLTCTHGTSTIFQRSEIKAVKLPHRGRSTAILGGIGAALGIGVVKAVASSDPFFAGHAKRSVYAGGAGIGAVLFGPLGYLSDMTRSTVYTAP